MAIFPASFGRMCIATLCCGCIALAALTPARTCLADDTALTLPVSIERQYRKVRTYYREIKDRLDEVENRLLELTKASGPEVEAEIKLLQAKREWYIGHAETLKVEMDYLAEQLKEATRDYGGK